MIAGQLIMVEISIVAILAVWTFLGWCILKMAEWLIDLNRRLCQAKETRDAFQKLRKLCKKIDQYLIERLTGKYIQFGALVACAAEFGGIFGVRAHGAILNVLSLIWVGIVPVTIIFHLAYREKSIKEFCEDAAVRLLVTVVMLLATWYSHATATSLITTLMGVDSSRFTSAVAATTFFGVVGLVSIVVAGTSVIFLLLGMLLTFAFPSPSIGQKRSFWTACRENSPRFLPFLFCAVAMIAVTPEVILGESNVTAAISARIAFAYDLSDPEICRRTSQHDRFLLLIDNPKRAIRYTANDLPEIPVTFMNLPQIKKILPIKQEEIDCK